MTKAKVEHQLLRALFMLFFWLLLRLSLIVTGALCVIQWFVLWFQEEPIEPMKRFASSLRIFQAQILDYLAYTTEDKPFPFRDWPNSEA